MSTQVLMPALSPTMSEGKLSKWLVKEGDVVKAGDLIAEIETDKAIMEFESSEDGTIINSKRNRLVLFPCKLKHRSTTSTDTRERINININYD